MSPAARNLVDSILRKDPEQRLTLADMGKHAWTTGDGRFPPPQDEEVCRCWVVTCARTTQPLCLRPRVCILCVDRVLRPCIETNNPQSDELVYQAVAPAATPPAAVPVPPTSAFALTPPPKLDDHPKPGSSSSQGERVLSTALPPHDFLSSTSGDASRSGSGAVVPGDLARSFIQQHDDQQGLLLYDEARNRSLVRVSWSCLPTRCGSLCDPHVAHTGAVGKASAQDAWSAGALL